MDTNKGDKEKRHQQQEKSAKGRKEREEKDEEEEEKGTKKERTEEMAKRREEKELDGKKKGEEEAEEEEEDDDDDDDDVVVIDSISSSSRFPSLVSVSVINRSSPPLLSSSSASVPTKMDPPPPSSAASPPHGQWFSAASFLSPSAGDDPSADPNQPQSSASAGAQRLLAELRQRYQPWAVFFRFSKFGCPPGLVSIGHRIKRNIAAFTTNYLCLFAILLLYCVLTSLLMLLTLVVLGGLLYSVYQFTRKGPLLIGSYEIPPSLLYTLALMASIPFFWLADAGSVMYWVLGSGLFLMLAHSTFYSSEEVPGSEFEVVVSA